MGLAGRKQKQRIPADPRNLSWADDASRFGLSYLSKFGWDASKGLGPSGDGIKTHLKVQQKLDMMGIGAQHQRDPNGIAWKQNKEFEALLKRLNESSEQEKEAIPKAAEGEDGKQGETATGNAFVRAHEPFEEKSENKSPASTKKPKRKNQDHPDTTEKTRKKRKYKHQESCSDESAAPVATCISEPPLTLPALSPRPMAHRARIRAATRISGKPASAISEILGIAPSSVSSSTLTPTPTPTPTPAPTSTPAPQPSGSLNNLTTSTKSVADYFKEKLLARSSASSSSSASRSVTPGLQATGLGFGSPSVPSDDSGPLQRGIGNQAPAVNVDDQEMAREKRRQRAERKAEKLKQRDAKASQATSKDVSTDAKKHMQGDDTERTTKKRRKHEKRQERKQQA